MIYVLDSSFVAAQIIPDEKDHLVDKMYSKIKSTDEKYVPYILWYEMANLFQNLVRRRRYTYEKVVQFFPLFRAIRLTNDSESGYAYSQKLLGLCNTYNLSSYDAAYLELAERKNAMLCTLDDGLRAAAKRHGVAVLR